MKILHQIYIHVHDTISAINIATILKLALLIYTEFCVQLWKKKNTIFMYYYRINAQINADPLNQLISIIIINNNWFKVAIFGFYEIKKK